MLASFEIVLKSHGVLASYHCIKLKQVLDGRKLIVIDGLYDI